MAPRGAGFTFQISIHCPIVAALFAAEIEMSNRRFEMYHYRQVLVRMRQGESDRQIATTGLMGRQAASRLRKQALIVNVPVASKISLCG
jgi:hypothetical protein